jgi:hypothetical protein
METYFVTNVLEILGVIAVTITLGRPLVKAIASRFERQGVQAVAPETLKRIEERLAHLTNGMEAMAIEVERISEGQRFTSRLLGEKKVAELSGPTN